MTRIIGRANLLRVPALACLLVLAAALPARALPPWLERYREYRVEDASGRTSPRIATTPGGRVAMRPVYAPPILMRARGFQFKGYPGNNYDQRGYGRRLNPAAYQAKLCPTCGVPADQGVHGH